MSTYAQDLFPCICFVQPGVFAPVLMSSAESHLGLLDSIFAVWIGCVSVNCIILFEAQKEGRGFMFSL